MKVALVHAEYRYSHLLKVEDEMRRLGPPVIRAIWCEDRQFWVALEGCHRLRAASRLGLEPIIKPVHYRPGMTWAEADMGREYVATASTIDEVYKLAGSDGDGYVLGFGKDALPSPENVRRPQEGEIMKYRIIQAINFDFGTGEVIGGVGREFTTADMPEGYDVTNWVSMGYLEIVEDAAPRPEVTKEVRGAPKRGRRG